MPVSTVTVWDDYADSLVGFGTTSPTVATVPDDLWDSWPDYDTGKAPTIQAFPPATFNSGPFDPSALLYWLDVDTPGSTWQFFSNLYHHLPTDTHGLGGPYVPATLPNWPPFLGKTIAFRVQGQGGSSQVYTWTGLNLSLVPPPPAAPPGEPATIAGDYSSFSRYPITFHAGIVIPRHRRPHRGYATVIG